MVILAEVPFCVLVKMLIPLAVKTGIEITKSHSLFILRYIKYAAGRVRY